MIKSVVQFKRIFATAMLGMTCFSCAEESDPGQRVRFEPNAIWQDNKGVHINAHGGGVMFHEDVYYWFGEHKLKDKIELSESKDPEKAAGGGVHCYSSKDLLNWKDEGLVLSVDYKNPESELAYGCVLERPKVLYNEKNKNFVMFFKLFPRGVGYSVCYVGVAVGNSPAGPFTFSHKFLAADSKSGTGDFALFKDDDGSAYHICSNKTNRDKCLVKLTDDYQKPGGPYSVLKGIDRATEAPAIFKKGGKYYMIGSGTTGWRPNPARSFSADSLTGRWTALGNPCVGVNPKKKLGPEKTFGGQSTFILPVNGKEDAYIAMFDVWRPKNPITGRYIWLPIQFHEEGFKIEWMNSWDLSSFDKNKDQKQTIHE